MALQFGLAKIEELKMLHEISPEDRTGKVYFFDTCAFEICVKDYPDLIKVFLEKGNFKIPKTTYNELKAWKEPGLTHPQERNKWKAVQDSLDLLVKKWPQNIIHAEPGPLFNELTLLEPLLSKTLTYELIMAKLEEVLKVMSDKKINTDKLLGQFDIIIKKQFQKAWDAKEKQCAKKFVIMRETLPSGFFETITKNTSVVLARMVQFLQQLWREGLYNMYNSKLFGLEKVRERMISNFKNKVENDKMMLAQYLLSDVPGKHLPTYDKDIYELAVMHRSMELV